MSANVPRYELRGHPGRYWVRMVKGRNIIWSNEQQGYRDKRDALRSIELSLHGVKVYEVQGALFVNPRGRAVEVRDMSGEAPLRPRRRVT